MVYRKAAVLTRKGIGTKENICGEITGWRRNYEKIHDSKEINR